MVRYVSRKDITIIVVKRDVIAKYLSFLIPLHHVQSILHMLLDTFILCNILDSLKSEGPTIGLNYRFVHV